MSRFLLCGEYALRSWKALPCALYKKGGELPFAVSEEAFAILLKADGKQDILPSDKLTELVDRGYVRPCGDEEKLGGWQTLRTVEGSLKPYLALEITERCNYRCLHCFNAADNTAPRSELSLETLDGLLNEAVDCGIQNVLITGGEPLCHPRFAELVRLIAEKGMELFELNTNGALLDAGTLEMIRECGFSPEIKISFDGLGFHDTLRGVAGAEERTLQAIALCLERGFRVKAQMNMNRENIHTILPSLQRLSEMGTTECRIIRTTEAPRWNENHGGATLSWEEYFTESLRIAGAYARAGFPMKLTFWEFLSLYPEKRAFRSECVRYNSRSYSDRRPICKTIYGMPAVGADGELYPCMQMSGFMKLNGIRLGSLYERPLRELLRSSPYVAFVNRSIGAKIRGSSECLLCPFLQYCGGGCPAIAQLTSGDFMGTDKAKCEYFRHGWHGKISDTLRDWTDLFPMN